MLIPTAVPLVDVAVLPPLSIQVSGPKDDDTNIF